MYLKADGSWSRARSQGMAFVSEQQAQEAVKTPQERRRLANHPTDAQTRVLPSVSVYARSERALAAERDWSLLSELPATT